MKCCTLCLHWRNPFESSEPCALHRGTINAARAACGGERFQPKDEQ